MAVSGGADPEVSETIEVLKARNLGLAKAILMQGVRAASEAADLPVKYWYSGF